MKYRPEIDGLRAVAVLLVLFFHAGFTSFSGGFVGVDIFFVISGFLINRLILTELDSTGTFSFGHFYLRRARRLGPALVATCAFSFIAGAFLFAPKDFGMLAASVVAALTSTSNIYLWLQAGYFDALSAVKPLLHTWSLSVEEQFYLIWPVLLVLIYRVSRRPHVTVPLVIAISFGASLSTNLWAQNGIENAPFLTDKLADGRTLIFYLMPFRVFELTIGAGLHWIIDRNIPAKIRDALFIAGAALIAYAVWHFDSKTIFPAMNGLIPCTGAALVMVGSPSHLGSLLRNRPAVGMGLISYSLYLIHWPLIVFYGYYKDGPLAASNMRSLIAISILLAVLMYFCIERPFRSRAHTSPRHFVTGLATACVALIAVAYPARSGWLWRLPAGSALVAAPNSEYGGIDCPDFTCSHGSQGRTIFVIGDSFSRQLYAGLTSAFPKQHFEFVDEQTCSFFSPKWSRWEDLPNEQRDCSKDREWLTARVKNDGARIIFAYNWVRKHYFDVSDPSVTKEFSDYGSDLAAFTYSEIVQLKAALNLSSVLVVANPPSIGDIRDLAWCLARPITKSALACRTIPETTVDSRRYLAQYHDHHGIQVLDPFDVFCDGSTCKNYDSDGLFYSDKYHLTRWGSQILIDHFKGEIAKWIQPEAP
jgi:peptidoglycan/LPS O-acetylase OafA/YrhL